MSSKSRLRKASVEFLTIVAGVLVALGADGWRERVAEQRLEAEYVDRLIGDIASDLDRLRMAAVGMERKRDPLRELMEVTETTVDEARVEEALWVAQGWAWDMRPAHSTTFDEMRSSGRGALIRDASLRDEIARFYAADEDMLGSIDARRTEFGPLAQTLFLTNWGDGESGLALLGPVDGVLMADLRSTARAEWNFAANAQRRLLNQANRAEELLGKLREYRAAL